MQTRHVESGTQLPEESVSEGGRVGDAPSQSCCGVPKQREPVQEFEWLTEAEAERLREACEPDLRIIVTVVLNMGFRTGELFSLEWRDIDFNQGLVLLRDTKNGDIRHVPMNARASAALKLQQRTG